MFRLTTKVARLPCISARSSSAATRISSTSSGRVSENSAVSSSSERDSPSRPLAIAASASPAGRDSSDLRPDPRRGMKLQYFSFTTSSTPCSIHSGSMYCGYTHSRSVNAYPRGASSFRTWCGLGNGSSGEMWSPFADSPPRSVAPASTNSGHQSERFGGI